jgi:hypothetical protein
MTPLPRRSAGVAALVVAVLVAACGSSTPSPQSPSPASSASAGPMAPSAAPSAAPSGPAPSPSSTAFVCDDSVTGAPATSDANDPNAATYTEIEQQVEQLRGITATTPVARGVFDQAGLCVYLRESFRRDNPETLVLATERLYKELGLMPQDASLEQLYLDLLTSQVAGLYDDTSKHMYVVSQDGAIGPTEEITYAHEYTHALQDQRFGLKAFVGEATDQSDRTMAKVTVVEGDATLLMTLWAQANLTPAELAKVAGSVDPASQDLLASMPAILKDPLEFPYVQGLQLTFSAFQGGGFAGVDGLYASPPDSTEQVLHPDKLQAREQPVAVAFPEDLAQQLGDGWSVTLQDTFGEMLLEVVLRDGGASGAAQAAAGWGGDRVALLEGPDGEAAVVIDTVWDTEADAGEFADALTPTVDKLIGLERSPSVLRPAPDRVVLVSATSLDTLALVANTLGLAG